MRKLAFCIIYLTISLVGCKNDKTTFDKAIKAYNLFSYSAAIDYFQLIIDKNEYDTLFFKSYYYQAKCFYFNKNYPSAIKNVDTLIKYFNLYSSQQSGRTIFNDQYYYLGDIYLGRAAFNLVMQKYTECQKDLNIASQYKITDTSGYYHLASLYKLAIGDTVGYLNDSMKSEKFIPKIKNKKTLNFSSILREIKMKDK